MSALPLMVVNVPTQQVGDVTVHKQVVATDTEHVARYRFVDREGRSIQVAHHTAIDYVPRSMRGWVGGLFGGPLTIDLPDERVRREYVVMEYRHPEFGGFTHDH